MGHDLVLAAVHEASHAIVGLAEGRTVDVVSIRPALGSLGRVLFAGGGEVSPAVVAAGGVGVALWREGWRVFRSGPYLVGSWAWFVSRQAAYEAQGGREAGGVARPPFAPCPSDGERLQALRGDAREEARLRARAILEARWVVVGALVDELLEHGELSGEAVTAALRRVQVTV